MKQFNRPARRSGSSQPTIRSITSSISAAITSLLPSTELQGPKHSRSGPKSVAWVGHKFPMHTAIACIRLTPPDKLTVPWREIANRHVVDHPSTQRGHLSHHRISCLMIGSGQPQSSQTGAASPSSLPSRASGFVVCRACSIARR